MEGHIMLYTFEEFQVSLCIKFSELAIHNAYPNPLSFDRACNIKNLVLLTEAKTEISSCHHHHHHHALSKTSFFLLHHRY